MEDTHTVGSWRSGGVSRAAKQGGANLQVQSSRDARGKPLMRVRVVRVRDACRFSGGQVNYPALLYYGVCFFASVPFYNSCQLDNVTNSYLERCGCCQMLQSCAFVLSINDSSLVVQHYNYTSLFLFFTSASDNLCILLRLVEF